MTSCLLLWNPRLYPTQRLVDEIEENRVGGSRAVRWNVATKKLSPGDRAFLMRVESQQGIIGVGTIATTPVRLPSWDPAKAAADKTQLFVNVLFEQLTELPLL